MIYRHTFYLYEEFFCNVKELLEHISVLFKLYVDIHCP